MMHADRTNRAALIVLALIAAAAGILGALAGFGLFGESAQHRPLVDNPVSRYFGREGEWLWPVVALVAGLVTLACLYWLWVLLFSTDRTGDLRLAGDHGAGRTTLAAGALTDAVTEEVGSYTGVSSAGSRLIGDPYSPALVITADLEDSADLAAVRRRIETEAARHARQALDRPDLPVQLDLTVTSRRTRHVA
jgi:hypothetical protein